MAATTAHTCIILGHKNHSDTHNFTVVTTFVHVHLSHQNSPYTHQFIYVTTALVHAHLDH